MSLGQIKILPLCTTDLYCLPACTTYTVEEDGTMTLFDWQDGERTVFVSATLWEDEGWHKQRPWTLEPVGYDWVRDIIVARRIDTHT